MREPLGPVDAAWFHLDRPENTADVVALLAFRRLPRFDRLRALVEERLVACPRFRQRVAGGRGLGASAWEDDPDFDLDRHLVRLHLAGPGALAARLSALASARLDPAHPLWRVEAVEGPGEAALLDIFALGPRTIRLFPFACLIALALAAAFGPCGRGPDRSRVEA